MRSAFCREIPGNALKIFDLTGRKEITTGHHQERIKKMRKDRNKIKSAVSTKGKTDSAKWRDRTFRSLTYAQIQIKQLCEAFQNGQITKEEFKRELPPILNTRDREKRSLNS
jgi:hypothetical protein